jgi:hypothetical protein
LKSENVLQMHLLLMLKTLKISKKDVPIKILSTSYKSQFNSERAITLACTISSCNHYLILCILNCKKKKLQQFCGWQWLSSRTKHVFDIK